MPLRIIIDLDGRRIRRPLPDGELVIGSAAPAGGVDLRVVHPSISRRHARLTVVDRKVQIEDLGSRNGTWIENRRLNAESELRIGQRLRLGSIEALVEEAVEGDLVAAVEMPRRPAAEAASPSLPQSTAALAPAQGFLHGEMPRLLEQLAEAEGRLEAVQAVGAALFASLPCLAVEIFDTDGRQPRLLFQGCREARSMVDEPLEIVANRGNTKVVVSFFQQGVARACRVVVEAATNLLRVSAKGLREPTSQPPMPSTKPPPLPAPPSLDQHLQQIYFQARRVAPGKVGVLIRGESGTGKEVLARYLHQASAVEGPFVAVNCAALPGDLLESELFGIERGVATGVEARPGKFEAAHGGTLLLDEIGDMALATQAKILRVLQEGEVHRLGGHQPRPASARVLAATHQDLQQMLAAGTFRSDLYHRIAGWEVTLPPLRQRRIDIANLAIHFLAAESERLATRPAGISRAALVALENFRWPGNVRQLRTEIARAALFLEDGELLDSALLSPALLAEGAAVGGSLKSILEAVERDEIHRALHRNDGSVPATAEALDLPVSTLYRRIKLLGLESQG